MNKSHCARRTLTRAVLILLLLFADRLQTFSQAPPHRAEEPRDLSSLSLDELLQHRLFTASRHLDDPRKAPAVVTVIGSDEIARFGWRTLADLLRSVPGIYTAYSLTKTYLGVRGSLEPADFNARVLLLVDGHRVNDSLTDMATLGADFPLDLSLIDHVEILRGAGSSLYGTNAELAVINILTRRPDAKPSIAVSTEADSFLARKLEIRSSFRAGIASVLLEASLYRENGPALVNLAGAYSKSPADEAGDRYDHLFATFRRNDFSLRGLFSARDKLVPGAPYDNTAAGPANRAKTQRGYLEAAYNGNLGEHTQLDLRAYYDSLRLHTSTPVTLSTGSNADYEISTESADWLGFEGVLGRHLGRQRIVAGAQVEYDPSLSIAQLLLSQSSVKNGALTDWLTAVFAEAELDLGTHLSLNLGGREDFTRQHQNSLSPRIAAMYLPTRSASLKFILAKAFRAPDPASLLYLGTNSSSSPSSLKPEHTYSAILTFSQQLSSHWTGTATGFQNKFTNLIGRVRSASGSNSVFSNGQGTRIRGLELEAGTTFPDGWSGRASYTFTHAVELSTGNRLGFSPAHLAKFNASAPLFRADSLGLELQYNSALSSDSGQRISPLFLGNATFLSRTFWNGLRFSASCFDCLNRSVSSSLEADPILPLPLQTARTWRFRIEYRRDAGRKQDVH